MRLDDIITELEKFATLSREEIDEHARVWGRAKARFLLNDELRKAKLNSAKALFSGSVAKKEIEAYNHPEYREFIDNVKFKEDEEFFVADAVKNALDKRIEVLRSLLAFHRGRVNQDM